MADWDEGIRGAIAVMHRQGELLTNAGRAICEAADTLLTVSPELLVANRAEIGGLLRDLGAATAANDPVQILEVAARLVERLGPARNAVVS